MAQGSNAHWMEKAFANSHGQAKAKAHSKGESTEEWAKHPGKNATTKTKRQAALVRTAAKINGR